MEYRRRKIPFGLVKKKNSLNKRSAFDKQLKVLLIEFEMIVCFIRVL